MDGNNASSPGEGLRQKIATALDAIFVLHVTTVVGAASVRDAEQTGAVTTVKLTDTPQKTGNTVVDTLLGDSTTIYSPDFLADPALVAAHKDAVQTAHDVRRQTMEMLKTVLQDFESVLFPKSGG